MRINIYKFWIESKQNKRELIIWSIIIFIITFLFSRYGLEPFFSYVDDTFGPKPNILSNVMILKNSNITEFGTNMQNFYFLYFLGTDWATLYFLNASDKEKIDKYESVISNIFFDFNNCPDCSYYTFALKNVGTKKADKIVIDIRSSVTPELIVNSPKMVKKDCGGYFESKGCNIIFENIEKEEEINFVLLIKDSSNLNVVSCMANEKYPCEFRFIKLFAQNIIAKKDVLIMDSKRILFPTLDNSEPNTFYYFDTNQSDESKTTWVSIPISIDEGK